MQPFTTRVSRHLRAPRPIVYRALLDADAVATWRVPPGMISRVHRFEAWEGGAIRISLTYVDGGGAGKTTEHTDTYHGRFERIVPDREVVEVLEFESASPGLAGPMRLTVTLADEADGTRLDAVHENVPPDVRPEDNELGWSLSLERLARLVEKEQSDTRG